LILVIAVIIMGWMHNTQAQSVTIDPQSIVPVPDTFDMEAPVPDVPPEMARFDGAWIGTWHDGISSWSSASHLTGMRTWFSQKRPQRSTTRFAA
jgi:hypothetical protein